MSVDGGDSDVVYPRAGVGADAGETARPGDLRVILGGTTGLYRATRLGDQHPGAPGRRPSAARPLEALTPEWTWNSATTVAEGG